MDCAFQCPFDDTHDLTDYFLINRIRTGLYDNTLQQEVLRKHDTLTSVDNIVQYCENFESTKKDRMIFNASSSPSVSTIHTDFVLAEEEIVAVVPTYKRQKQISISV